MREPVVSQGRFRKTLSRIVIIDSSCHAAVAVGVSYMIRRAAGELRVCEGAFGGDHELLISDFLAAREFDRAYEEIFCRIPKYLEQSRTAFLLEGRKGDRLVAFTVADFGSADLRSIVQLPLVYGRGAGASDLLFYETIRMAEERENAPSTWGWDKYGVRRFKEKWGAVPFLPYQSAVIRRRPRGLLSLLRGF